MMQFFVPQNKILYILRNNFVYISIVDIYIYIRIIYEADAKDGIGLSKNHVFGL